MRDESVLLLDTKQNIRLPEFALNLQITTQREVHVSIEETDEVLAW